MTDLPREIWVDETEYCNGSGFWYDEDHGCEALYVHADKLIEELEGMKKVMWGNDVYEAYNAAVDAAIEIVRAG